MPFHLLPPELIVQILCFLPVQDIRALNLVSRYYHDVVLLNERVIYEAAATFHGFIGPSQDRSSPPLISEVTSRPDSTGLLDGVSSWKEICRRCVLREHAWTGKQRKGPQEKRQSNRNSFLPNILAGVYHFKVDEVERTVVCLMRGGGLLVKAIDTGRVLWHLPSTHVANYAQMEYDKGFIVFTRPQGGVEVWRRSTDCFHPERYLQCSPDPSQVRVSPYPVPEFPPSFPPLYDGRPASPDSPLFGPNRGVYLPFALLVSPAPGRWYRLVYPHLLVASDFNFQAFIWHIPTSALVETIKIRVPPTRVPQPLPRIAYVDFNSSFIFVAWTSALALYHREPAGRKKDVTVLLDLQSMVADPGRVWVRGLPCDTFMGHVLSNHERSNPSSVHPLPGPCRAYSVTKINSLRHFKKPRFDWFSAIHVSPDGRDLVAATGAGWLIYIPDFQIILPRQRKRPPFRICFSWNQTRYLHDLAFDGTRIILAIGSGVMSITVQDFLHPNEALLVPKIRHLAVLPGPRYDGATWKVTCIQVHSGSAWLAYHLEDGRNAGGLACINLSAAATGLKQDSFEASGQQWGVGLGANCLLGSRDLLLASVPVSLLAVTLLVRPDWTSALRDQLYPSVLKLESLVMDIIRA
ncbi:hypothetical protein M407DRAFT_29543 [Tulasnella calospora MUT 4182]|uniref:F-box domain-containing protein n=1 Tax=Tulasnella calospora MUT 4182 TaxID=1051891 RepID=A0A0C3PZD3_9AGAM|nr:hypothetical protein M407DRAFT_29543 [Tulasnella calospora MUT 4182]